MRPASWFVITLVTASFFVIPAASAQQKEGGKTIAVLIGVNYYSDPNIPVLNWCAADAELMQKTLIEKCKVDEKNIDLLTVRKNDEITSAFRWPTLRKVTTTVTAALNKAQPEDTVLVFFSGHGFNNKGGILATQDCDMKDLANTGLSTQWLKTQLSACQAKRKLLILDCCHAGAAGDKGTGPDIADPLGAEFGDKFKVEDAPTANEVNKAIYQKSEGLITLASCGPKEKSREFEDKQQGLFTFYLVMGLNGAADVAPQDGFVDHQELYRYLLGNVSAYAKKRFETEQNPTMHLNGVSGLFALATVATVRRNDEPQFVFPAPPIPEDLLPKKPKSPQQQAELAFNRLKGKSVPGMGNPEDEADAKLLTQEAQRLRTLVDPAGQSLNLSNPFFEADRANMVYDWMVVAERVFKDKPASLQISLALAARYSQPVGVPDAAKERAERIERARKIVDSLKENDPNFWKSEAAKGVEAQLMVLLAETRPSDAAGRKEALEWYLKALDLIKAHDLRNGKEPMLNAIAASILDPASRVAASLGAGLKKEDVDRIPAELRPAVARIYGEYGELIRRGRYSDMYGRAKEFFEQAERLNPNDHSYKISLEGVRLLEQTQDYQRAIAVLDASLAQLPPSDQASRGLAHSLLGDSWLKYSRQQTDNRERVAMLGKARDSYDKAIAAYGNSMRLRDRDRVDLANVYQNRSLTRVELANLTPNLSNQQRVDQLLQATTDADAAKNLDPFRSYKCHLAIGNAYEDLAWIGCKKEYYPEALKAFKTATDDRWDKAECFTALGRCHYKAGEYASALEQLKHSLSLQATPEAHYWMAKLAADARNRETFDMNKAVEHADLAMADYLERTAKKDPSISPRDVASSLKLSAELWTARLAAASDSEVVKAAKATVGDRLFRLRSLDPPQTFHAAMTQVELNEALAKRALAAGDKTTLKAETDTAYQTLRALLGPSNPANLDDCKRLEVLCKLLDIGVHSHIKDTDFAQASPQLMADADEAGKIIERVAALQMSGCSNHDKLLKDARGCAGLTKLMYGFHTLVVKKDKPAATALLTEAEALFIGALPANSALAAEYDNQWRWAHGFGRLCTLQAKLKVPGYKAKAESWLAFAVTGAPEAEKQRLREQLEEVKRLP